MVTESFFHTQKSTSNNNKIEGKYQMMFLRLPIATLLILLVGSVCGSHRDPAPLRSYTCKDTNAQHPCSLCPEGYFCTTKDLMQACGSADVFCPLGSFKPTPVSDGYYTMDGGAQSSVEMQHFSARKAQ